MSLYWDDFEKRARETASCIKVNKSIPIRRISIHITNKCNFRCKYCNVNFGFKEMSQDAFEKHSACQFGCNRRLVKFNEEVQGLIKS